MRLPCFFLILLGLCLCSSPTLAGPEDLTAGVKHYRQGEYRQALVDFQSARTAGLCDGRLEYNLGNCWWRLQEPARALVCYERARQWFPRDPAVAANIRLCRKTLGLDRSTAVPFLKAISEMAAAFTLRELVQLAVLGGGVLFLGLILWVFLPRARLAWLALVGALGLLLFGGQALYRHLDRSDPALVVASEIELKAEPREDLPAVVTLRGGVAVTIVGREDQWCLVVGPEQRGWLPVSAIGRLQWDLDPWLR